ncbi:MAG: cytochrome c peroxidase [Planctomycetota bacterium]
MARRSLLVPVSAPLVVILAVLAGASDASAAPQRLRRVPIPPGNEMTEAKVLLGMTLFWDEQLSSSKTVSCGTCHMPEAGGSDPRAWMTPGRALHPGPDGVFGTDDDSLGSIGVPERTQAGSVVEDALFDDRPQATNRRPRTVLAAAYMTQAFWDGRAEDVFVDPETGEEVLEWGAALETQSLKPMLSSVEMGAHGRTWAHVARDLVDAEPLALSPEVPERLETWIDGRDYPELFEEAFGRADLSAAQFAMAVASYERTLIPDQTPILQNKPLLTDQELEGLRVFHAKGCAECHSTRGGLFSDQTFHFIGATDPETDPGLAEITGEDYDRGLFLTPTLLGVELRAPYFHDGSKANLDEVIDFYDRGGDFGSRRQREIVPARFTDDERAALRAFLGRPLTDPRLLTASGPFERPLLSSEADGRRTAPIRGISGPASTPLYETPSLVQAEPYRPFAPWLPGRAATIDLRSWVRLESVPTEDLMEMAFEAPSVVPVDPVLLGASVLAEFRPLFAQRAIRSSVTLAIQPSL